MTAVIFTQMNAVLDKYQQTKPPNSQSGTQCPLRIEDEHGDGDGDGDGDKRELEHEHSTEIKAKPGTLKREEDGWRADAGGGQSPGRDSRYCSNHAG